MNDKPRFRMADATRLTREGRLDEATSAIQSALGTFPAGHRTGAAAPIDVSSHPLRNPMRNPSQRPSRRFSGRAAGAPAGAPASGPDGARFVERSYSCSAGGRAYKLYVPSGYGGEAVPLVVMLHGCTQNPDDFAVGTRMNELAEEQGFLVVYPAQSGNANAQRCWNWFQAADQRRGSGEPEIIAGITRQVVEDYEIDADRVAVAGMSAGGAMAAIVGSEYPDLFAAVGVHSGLAPGSARDMSSAFTAMRQGSPGAPLPAGGAEIVPTILFHGDRDGTVHPRNGDRLLAHSIAGRGSSLGVTTRQGRVPEGHAFTHLAYKDADDRPLVERWTVHGLGHAWSGGSYPGSYTDARGPDASAAMVRFFAQHARA